MPTNVAPAPLPRTTSHVKQILADAFEILSEMIADIYFRQYYEHEYARRLFLM